MPPSHKTKDLTKFKNRWLLDEFIDKINYPKHDRAVDSCKYVYLIANKLTGLCKIGQTNFPNQRVRSIACSSGMDITKLLVIELLPGYDESAFYIENFLHTFFKEKRKIGEWFELSIRDVLQIRMLFFLIEGEEVEDNLTESLHEIFKRTGGKANHH